MELNDYQKEAAKTDLYRVQFESRCARLEYTAMGLAGEAGEVANNVKKIRRDDDERVTNLREAVLLDELGDVLWYVAMMADELGISLEAIASHNVQKLEHRHGS